MKEDNKVSGGVWVKASRDNLPPQATGKEFFIKYKGHPYVCKCMAFKFAFREGTFPYSDVLTEEHYKDIEWLDESLTPLAVDEDEVGDITSKAFRDAVKNKYVKESLPLAVDNISKESVEDKAKEYATEMMGLGEYSEKWEYNFSPKHYRVYISCVGTLCITTQSFIDKSKPPRVFKVVGVLEQGAWVTVEII